jgi:5-bromo-4-chloroindolyl phosphate hydrolysis protein
MNNTIPSHLEIYQEIANKPEGLKSTIEIKYETLFDRWVDLNDKYVKLKEVDNE